MTFWEQLQARELPTSTVPLPIDGGTVEVVLRALPPAEWEALVEAFPARGDDGDKATPGMVDTRAMRPALLAASVVAPDGSPPKDPAWWEDLATRGAATVGELTGLFDEAWALNMRRPGLRPDLGKD